MEIRVRFYINGGLEVHEYTINQCELHSIITCGKVCINNKNYKLKFSCFNLNERSFDSDLEEI